MKKLSLLLMLLLSLSLLAGLSGCGNKGENPTSSYTGTTAPMAMHSNAGMNFAQRHKTAVSLGAGYAAYKAAKITGANRAANGGHMNFAQRHPVMTGIGAAMITHHMISHMHH